MRMLEFGYWSESGARTPRPRKEPRVARCGASVLDALVMELSRRRILFVHDPRRWFNFPRYTFLMRILILIATLVMHAASFAQPALVNTDFLDQWAATNRFRLGQPTDVKVTPDGTGVLFLRSGPRSFVKDLYHFDVATGKERVLLTAASLLGDGAENLSAEELARRERARSAARGIASFSLSDDGRSLLVPLAGRLFVLEYAKAIAGEATPRELTAEGGAAIDPRFSPDGSRVACVRGGSLYIIDIATGHQKRLSPEAAGTVSYAEAEFVAQEEMGRDHGYWFSPDGERVLFQKTDTQGMELFAIADAFKPESAPRTWPYPRAGKQNAAVSLWLVPSDGGAPVQVTWDAAAFPYLASVSWTKNAPLTILVQNRTQTDQMLLSVNDSTGATRQLVRERDKAWHNINPDMPKWLPDGTGFLWLSEQDAFDGLRLDYHDKNGVMVRALYAKSQTQLLELVHIDQVNKYFIFTATDDPSQVRLWRLPMPGNPIRGQPQLISPDAPGLYGGVFATNASTWVRTSNTLDGTLTWEVIGPGGEHVGNLSSAVEEPPFMPKVAIEKVRVGDADFYAAVIRPRDFDPAKKYPVINSVYGGPHNNTVNAAARTYLMQQWLADQGFIVVSIDARGTPRRGKAWERAIKGDVISRPLEEQAAVMQALGTTFPEMDMTRVGITGWSFGGYFAAHAAMRRPDLFKAAVAGAPVADWADYDTHYTERYMGLPADNASGYAKANVLTYCKDLSVPLLIIHGTADDNVYSVNSLKMVDALFRAGKKFEFIPLGGMTHAVNEPETVRRLHERIATFFIENLNP